MYNQQLHHENHQKIKRDWWVFDDGSVIIDRTMHEAVILALDLDGGVDFDADTPFAIAIYEGSLNITIIAEDNDHYYWHYHCYKDHLLSQSKSDKESIAIFHKSLGDLLIELYGRVGTTINIDNLSYPEHVSDTIEIIDNSTGNITNGLSFTIEIDNDITEFWAVPVNGTEEYDYYVVTSDDLNGNRYAAPWSLYRDRK